MDCTGAFHRLKLSPEAAEKSAFITHLGKIEYEKGSLNLIADSLSRLRTGEHYEHNTSLHNTEPIILKKKAEVNMVTTCAKSTEQEKLTPKLPDLQIRLKDILKTLDKHQLIMNTEKVLVIADNDYILRMKVDHKGDTLEAILLAKGLRPWIIASTHKFCGHQGRDCCYYKIRATYFWNGMKNNICQAISNCKICKMELPNLG